jgi:hypothetical protein
MAHPAIVAALVVLVVNDHWAKARFANALTGKLSDVAGLVLTPTLLVATCELLARRSFARRAEATTAAAALVGVSFALCKCWSPATEAYRWLWGRLRHPLDVAHALWTGDALPAVGTVAFVQDATDLFALVALAVPVWLSVRKEGPSRNARATAVCD